MTFARNTYEDWKDKEPRECWWDNKIWEYNSLGLTLETIARKKAREFIGVKEKDLTGKFSHVIVRGTT